MRAQPNEQGACTSGIRCGCARAAHRRTSRASLSTQADGDEADSVRDPPLTHALTHAALLILSSAPISFAGDMLTCNIRPLSLSLSLSLWCSGLPMSKDLPHGCHFKAEGLGPGLCVSVCRWDQVSEATVCLCVCVSVSVIERPELASVRLLS
jgi:hypothetical protein